MNITAKELAQKLNLSATAVSMALNNKPGVSTKTRQLVIKAAEENGFDFSKLKSGRTHNGSVYLIFYKASNAILSYVPIFEDLFNGVKEVCQKEGLGTQIVQFYEKTDHIERLFSDLRVANCAGIILLGTEMSQSSCEQFIHLGIPMILLDTYFDSLKCTSVLINNAQGAYAATDYLISITGTQPGYLQSSYQIPNFAEREEGYFRAIKMNGMSTYRSQIHKLSPSIGDAMADMLKILDEPIEVSRCYFADNDEIAIGAMKALKLRGYRIPEDVCIIGFDNISEGRVIEPSLTTMDVPRQYIGQVAARLLIEQLDSPVMHHSKVSVSTHLVKRFSTRLQ